MSDSEIIGPVLPSSSGQKCEELKPKCYGPTLPPNVALGEPSSAIDEGEDSDDSYGPALPPGLNSQVESDDAEEFEDDDSEDGNVVGPLPEGLVDKNHQYDASIRLKKRKKDVTKREKWMLEPPKQLKATLQTKSVTQFSQKSSKHKDKPLTEEEKLQLEVVKEREQNMEEFLHKYKKEKKRDVSLLDMHRSELKNKKPKVEKKDRKEFDRDKDLNVSRMDAKTKSSFIKTASSTFGTRFSSGKFEKFL